jgi:hypothetical protein
MRALRFSFLNSFFSCINVARCNLLIKRASYFSFFYNPLSAPLLFYFINSLSFVIWYTNSCFSGLIVIIPFIGLVVF